MPGSVITAEEEANNPRGAIDPLREQNDVLAAWLPSIAGRTYDAGHIVPGPLLDATVYEARTFDLDAADGEDFNKVRDRYRRQVARWIASGGTNANALDSAATDWLWMVYAIRGTAAFRRAATFLYGPPPFPINSDTRPSVFGRVSFAPHMYRFPAAE